ncbi:MAG: hypothetical protein JWP77_2378 [Polaromonas sp.]|nr:hypothetical protein [Polaromonas sp.]
MHGEYGALDYFVVTGFLPLRPGTEIQRLQEASGSPCNASMPYVPLPARTQAAVPAQKVSLATGTGEVK